MHLGLALVRLALLERRLFGAQPLSFHHIGLEHLHRLGHLANLVRTAKTRDGDGGVTFGKL